MSTFKSKNISRLLVFVLLMSQIIMPVGAYGEPFRQPKNPIQVPVAQDDIGNTLEDMAVRIFVLDNDNGNVSTINVVSQPANGTSLINNDHTVTYIPNKDFNGTDSFTYTAASHSYYSTATVSVTVKPVNDPPEAVDDTVSTLEDNPVVIPVLTNDKDLDGEVVVLKEVLQPANGTVTANQDGTLTYTPNANFSGNDTFTYSITSGIGDTDLAAVTVTVVPVNNPPDAKDDAAVTIEDTNVIIPVLENDTDNDGDSLAVLNVSEAMYGSVDLNTDGTVTYQPNPNFAGIDTFTYALKDGSGETDTATVTVTVTQVNDPPVAVEDIVTTVEDNPLNILVLLNDQDIDGDNLSVVKVSSAANGIVDKNPDGTVIYTPDPDFAGTDSYMVDDGFGLTDEAAVTVTVEPVNDPPEAFNDTAQTPNNQAVVIEVLANDRDRDGDSLNVVFTSEPLGGTVMINQDRILTYTPNINFAGIDNFTYTISDSYGGTAAAKVTVNVIDNVPPEVLVNSPVDKFETNSGQLEVSGTAEPGSSVTVNAMPASSDQSGNFSAIISLAPGVNNVTVYATDTAGNVTMVNRTVYFLPNNKITGMTINPNPIRIGSSASIQYTLSISSYMTINIYQESGEHVRTLMNNVLRSAGANYLTWDGKDKNGVYISDGNYSFVLEATDSTGTMVGRSIRTVLAANVPKVTSAVDTPDPYNPLEGGQAAITYTLSNDALVTVSILNGAIPVRNLVNTLGVQSAGTYTVLWDGRDNNGNIVPDALYSYQIDTTSPLVSTFKTIYKGNLFVEKEPPQLTNLNVTVNPLRLGHNSQGIRFTLSEKASVNLEILDNSGNHVRTVMNDVLRMAGIISVSWDGKNDAGVYVPDGNYTVTGSAVDSFGKVSEIGNKSFTAAHLPVVSNLTFPSLFNPSQGNATINYGISHEALVTLQVLSGTMTVLRTLTDNVLLPSGNYSLAWDGKDENGTMLPDANYNIQVRAVSPTVSNFIGTAKLDLTVEQNYPEITDFNLYPNPLKISTQALSIRYNMSESATVTVTVLRGTEVVRNLVSDQLRQAGILTHVWDGKDNFGNYISDGVYNVVVQAVDAFGKTTGVSGNITAAYQPVVSNPAHSPELYDPTLGIADINFNLSKSADVTVSILKGNAVVKSIQTGILPEGPNTVKWDGSDGGMKQVADGSYTYKIEAVSPTVDTFKSLAAGTMTVEGSAPILVGLTGNPMVVKIGTTAQLRYNVSEPAVINVQVLNALDYSLVREFPAESNNSDGIYSVSWNTEDNTGNFIATGDYILKVTATDKFNKIGTAELLFLAENMPVLSNVSVTPSTIDLGSGQQATFAYNINEYSYATIRIYNSAGQVYKTLDSYKEVIPGTNSIVWDGKADNGLAVNGVFTYTIDAISAVGSFKAVQAAGTIEVIGASETSPLP